MISAAVAFATLELASSACRSRVSGPRRKQNWYSTENRDLV